MKITIGAYLIPQNGALADLKRAWMQADELGVDPGSELTRIHQQLLAMDPALDGPVTAPAVTIRAVRRQSSSNASGSSA